MNKSIPNRAMISSYLEDLIAGRRSREAVADWAVQFILGDYDDVPVSDEVAWEMLSNLAGADLLTGSALKDLPEGYLFGKEDFADWMEQMDRE